MCAAVSDGRRAHGRVKFHEKQEGRGEDAASAPQIDNLDSIRTVESSDPEGISSQLARST